MNKNKLNRSQFYEPEAGDYVRACREGRVKAAASNMVNIDDGCHSFWIVKEGYSFEKINPPEPEWQPRDVVVDAEGDVFVRKDDDENSWLYISRYGTAFVASNEDPVRPLRRLVPEGEGDG